MPSKYMKGKFNITIHEEMQIIITVRYHFILNDMYILAKVQKNPTSNTINKIKTPQIQIKLGEERIKGFLLAVGGNTSLYKYYRKNKEVF